MSIPHTETSTPVCSNCGAVDAGTSFCESCGVPLAAQRQTAVRAAAIPAAPVSPAEPAPRGAPVSAVGGVPQVLYLVGVIGSSILSITATFTANIASSDNAGLAAILLILDVLTITVDLVALVGLVRLAATSSAVTALKVLGATLFLSVPTVDVVILVSDVTRSFGGYVYQLGNGFVSFALIAALSWLMVGRFAGRSYFLLFIVLGTNLLSSLLQGVGYGVSFVAFFALRTAIVAAGLVVVVVVAPRIKRGARARLTPTTNSTTYGPSYGVPVGSVPTYAPVGSSSTTNGFAIAALIVGLLGGTVLPIIFGHVAHSQIKRTGQAGWGMATGGLVLGYVCTAVVLVFIIVAIVAAVQAPHYY